MKLPKLAAGWVELETSGGLAYVRPEKVIGVTNPFMKPGQPLSRWIALEGGQKFFMLANDANMAALGINRPGGLPPGMAAPTVWEPPVKRPRGRPRKTVAPAPPGS